ncbi:MAG: hypothetical protein ABFS09_05505 [Thermodesulfobacteriota bacterium]
MKKALTLTLALFLAMASNQALAATTKCKITAIKDGTISLDCGSKADTFKIGDEVKIRAAKKQKAIEGC